METRKAKKSAPIVDEKTGEITEVVIKKEEEKVDLSENNTKPKVYPFELQQLVMKNEQWEMHTLVIKTLNSVSKNYNLTLIVNLDPIDEKIDLALKRIEKGGQMRIDGSSQAQEEYNAFLTAKQELIDNCPQILIKASVLRTKYVPGKGTQIVFWIPSEIINELNTRRNYIEHYNIKMESINLAS